MTTTTAAAVPAASARRTRGVDWPTLQRFARPQLITFVWLWVGMVLLASGILESNSRTIGVDQSAVATLANLPRSVQGAMGIVVVTSFFVSHVASGRTRRALVTSAAVTVTAFAVANAAALTLAFQIEQSVFDRNGWTLAWNTGHLFTSTDQVALVFAESLGTALAFGLGGILIGAGYRRWGGLRGTLALPLTAAPVLLAIAVVELRSTSDLGARLGVAGLDALASLAVLAALALAALVASYPVLRGAAASPMIQVT